MSHPNSSFGTNEYMRRRGSSFLQQCSLRSGREKRRLAHEARSPNVWGKIVLMKTKTPKRLQKAHQADMKLYFTLIDDSEIAQMLNHLGLPWRKEPHIVIVSELHCTK